MTALVFVRPPSFAHPLTYGVDTLHWVVHGGNIMSPEASFLILGAFCICLFMLRPHDIERRWIL